MQGRVTTALFVGVALAWAAAGNARAEVSTELSGSILVFPKVLANGTRDTIIQISNTSNTVVKAHCFYVNAALRDPTEPQGPLNPPLWQEIDFDILLTKQQPTHWVVGDGRQVNPFDPTCGNTGVCVGGTNAGAFCDDSNDCNSFSCSNINCNDAGFDPGRIPPVVPDFQGELKCVEVDTGGAPVAGNHLKGEASLVRIDTGVAVVNGQRAKSFLLDMSQYNALAILGSENNSDGVLVLGGGQCAGDGADRNKVCTADDQCGASGPCLFEYNACPQSWLLLHPAEGAPDPIIEGIRLGPDNDIKPDGPPSQVYTELTVVPCTENFETQVQTSVTLQFQTWDEFESVFSVSTTITCWGNFFLSDLGAPALLFDPTHVLDPAGTLFMQSRIRPAQASSSGVLMVAETFYIANLDRLVPPSGLAFVSTAAANLHVEGERTTPDIITIPADQLTP